jgi:hypothetical protein
MAIFTINSSSFQDFEVSGSFRAGPNITIDFSQASGIIGTSSWANNSTTASYALVGTSNIVGGIRTITSNYTASSTDYTILCNNTASIGIYLPAGLAVGSMYNIKHIIIGPSITIKPASGLIDNSTNQIITNKNDSMTTQWDGSNWWIL